MKELSNHTGIKTEKVSKNSNINSKIRIFSLETIKSEWEDFKINFIVIEKYISYQLKKLNKTWHEEEYILNYVNYFLI